MEEQLTQKALDIVGKLEKLAADAAEPVFEATLLAVRIDAIQGVFAALVLLAVAAVASVNLRASWKRYEAYNEADDYANKSNEEPKVMISFVIAGIAFVLGLLVLLNCSWVAVFNPLGALALKLIS